MAKYSAFLGRKVEVLYRAGDILLPASGTFVADSGRSIFLEQHFVQKGQERNVRWEIPYQYIVRLGEVPAAAPVAAAECAADPAPRTQSAARPVAAAASSAPSAAASKTSGTAGSLVPLPNGPETA
jgi:hypothetical protein